MSASHRSPRSIRVVAAFMVAALGLASLLACSSDKSTNPNPNPGGSTTTFTGTVAGTGANGKLTITLATTSPAPQNAGYRASTVVTATGTFTPTGAAAIGLGGNYDDGAKVVGLTGGGWTFGGGLSGTGLEGNAAGPGGEFGYFTLLRGGSEVIAIVGRFTSTTGGDNGDFNVSVNGTEVRGNAVPDGGGTAIPLDGTYDAGTGAISIPPLATGTYSSTTGNASGTFDDGAGNSGTWAGSKQ